MSSPALSRRDRTPQAATWRTWLTDLAGGCTRSIRSLGLDGWFAFTAVMTGLVAVQVTKNVPWVGPGVLWKGLAIIGVVRLLQVKGIRWPLWLLRQHPVLCGLLLIALVSTTWSEHPQATLFGASSLIATTLVGVAIGALLPGRRLMAAWMWGLAPVVGICLLIFLFAPNPVDLRAEDVSGRFLAFAHDKNHAGRYLCFVTTLFAAATMTKMIDRHLGIWLTGIFVVGTLLTQSATAILGMVASITAISGILLSKRFALSVPTILVVAGISTSVVIALGIIYVDQFTEFFGKKPTLTGRTPLWTAVIETIERQPLTGYGYFGIWRREDSDVFLSAFSDQDVRWNASHAHNGFLQVAIDLGIPVAILTVLYVFAWLFRAIKTFHHNHATLALFSVGFFMWFIVVNIGTVTLLRGSSGIWIAFVATTVALACSKRRHRGRAASPDRRGAKPAAPESVRDGPQAAASSHLDDEAARLNLFREQLRKAVARDDEAARLRRFRERLHHALKHGGE